MKIIRYLDDSGNETYGCQHDDGSTTRIDGDILGEFTDTGETATVSKLLAPIKPAAVLCIGLNYRKHADESNAAYPEHPILFIKMPSVVQNPEDPIILPTKLASHEVDYECELAVVIGKTCKNATKENALDYVLGYTCANDVSARDWQIKWGGSQWCRGKNFDTFCPLGPCLVTSDEISDPNALGIKTILNGEALQDWNTDDMIFDVPTLIEFLSGSTTLAPGTVILTGTPQGVGAARKPPVFLKDGDTCTIEIENIGALTNPVINEA
ncbi:MAG: 5-carboxymethyl-2-hydroxymuconate isomerase [Planctomycetaceae bacterium]|nr:5-carboxymethyl-2-hydroxymuconate isomerase [Planctomycetaceae bacterium]